ncbi:hypothetical protein OE88DRAFT_1730008 [Heliocybe sulcata]|uniref:Uncharacterized protein n=1 Tax=Heliocybe sulcata TaxID=5364 RepID=A0A5C3NGR0_9AGAM|nr:hypothetical protein OE88DRAFT_1730008 [Heliocybe sulcata]
MSEALHRHGYERMRQRARFIRVVVNTVLAVELPGTRIASSMGTRSGRDGSCRSADADGPAALAQTVNAPLPVRHLLISPNLEALLEHDYRARAALLRTASPVEGSSSETATPIIGLPPPPRKRRSRPNTAGAAVAPTIVDSETRDHAHPLPCKASSRPTTAKEHESVSAAASVSDVSTPHPYDNPFLNPAPSLQSLASRSSATFCSGASLYTSDFSDDFHDKPCEFIPSSPLDPTFSNDPIFGSTPRRVSLIPRSQRLSSYHGPDTTTSSLEWTSGRLDHLATKASQLSLSFRRDAKRKEQQPRNRTDSEEHLPVASEEAREVRLLDTPSPTGRKSQYNEEMSSAASFDSDHSDAYFPQPKGTQPFAATSGNITSAASLDIAGGVSAPSIRSHASKASNASHSSGSSRAPTSSATHNRISISSTQYPSSMNTSESKRHRRPERSHPTLPPQSANRESFIDLGSPSSPNRPSSDGSDYSGQTSPAMPTFVVYNPAVSSKPSMDSDASVPLRPRLSGRSPTSMSFPVTSSSQKPPVPTAPKPKFRRSASAQPSEAKRREKASSSSDTLDLKRPELSLPPTTNHLNSHERAELIRKTRKLTQMFGKPPAASAVYPESPILGLAPQLLSQARRGHHRGAASMVDNGPLPRGTWPPPEGTQYLSPTGRRFSTPLSPDQLSFLSVDTDNRYIGPRSSLSSRSEQHIEVGTREGEPQDGYEDDTAHSGPPDSPTSFMDLSDEDADDMSSFIDADSPKSARRRRPFSPSTPSLMETLNMEGQSEEEERRRKRERLAKLHRFLGSRVPVGLVLGVEDPVASALPPPALETVHSEGEEQRKAWVRRRRSSSAAAFPSHWSDEVDRVKEDLDEREKAINVRRAQKMEKMFGATPPQALYHTRKPSTMVNTNIDRFGQSHSPSPTAGSAPSPTGRNPNQSAYVKKPKGKKKSRRPGTSESAKGLLRPESVDYSPQDGSPADRRLSAVYMHYRHSLKSLNDILDRDDRESLAQLHQYLNGEEPAVQTFAPDPQPVERKLSISSSIRSDRRRSLPPRTSILSLASEYNLGSPDAEMTSFQLRRRKAAKLTNFFGVQYKELISDVLESIEKGVEEDGGKGTLKPDEVQDLMKKLRRLRTKRDVIS